MAFQARRVVLRVNNFGPLWSYGSAGKDIVRLKTCTPASVASTPTPTPTPTYSYSYSYTPTPTPIILLLLLLLLLPDKRDHPPQAPKRPSPRSVGIALASSRMNSVASGSSSRSSPPQGTYPSSHAPLRPPLGIRLRPLAGQTQQRCAWPGLCAAPWGCASFPYHPKSTVCLVGCDSLLEGMRLFAGYVPGLILIHVLELVSRSLVFGWLRLIA